ncbi:Swt1 family HEPN domain-containing protein [Gordonia sp. NPDC058843]|uniref:Swt1 family HEPN domain-containing protein n=1 Tax=Gordonia sp. NPDC058843 TaxID=3346648 RepID=UPI0036898067
MRAVRDLRFEILHSSESEPYTPDLVRSVLRTGVEHVEFSWPAVLFSCERDYLAPALDEFFVRTVGAAWNEILRDVDARRTARRPRAGRSGEVSPAAELFVRGAEAGKRYNTRDPQVCLRMLTDDDIPRNVRAQIRRALPEEARGLGVELRKFRNDLHHNELMTDEEILRALDSCERLLLALDKTDAVAAVRAERYRLGKIIYADPPVVDVSPQSLTRKERRQLARNSLADRKR